MSIIQRTLACIIIIAICITLQQLIFETDIVGQLLISLTSNDEQHINRTTLSDENDMNATIAPLLRPFKTQILIHESKNITKLLKDHIALKYQVDRINKVFSEKFKWNYKFELSEMNEMKKKVAVISFIHLSAFDIKNQRFSPLDSMLYHYKNKLYYCMQHGYTFVIDTFDYLSYLKCSKNVTIDASNLFNYTYYASWMSSKGIRCSSTGPKTRHLKPHWNKVLVIAYWSNYFDYLIYMDDDAIFSNPTISLNFIWNTWLKQNQYVSDMNMNDIFLLLPNDWHNSFRFSNFAFIFRTEYQISSLFINWWFKNLARPDWFNEQGAMWMAAMQYFALYDKQFNAYLHSINRTNIFRACAEQGVHCEDEQMIDRCMGVNIAEYSRHKYPQTASIIYSRYNENVLKTCIEEMQSDKNLCKIQLDVNNNYHPIYIHPYLRDWKTNITKLQMLANMTFIWHQRYINQVLYPVLRERIISQYINHNLKLPDK